MRTTLERKLTNLDPPSPMKLPTVVPESRSPEPEENGEAPFSDVGVLPVVVLGGVVPGMVPGVPNGVVGNVLALLPEYEPAAAPASFGVFAACGVLPSSLPVLGERVRFPAFEDVFENLCASSESGVC